MDLFVNRNYEELDADSVQSVCDMLDSEDKSIQGLGLRTLCGFNIQATPGIVTLMISSRPKLYHLPEWQSVGFQQVLATLKWDSFLYDLFHIRGRLPKELSDKDRELCKIHYKDLLLKSVSNEVNTLLNNGIKDILHLGIDIKLVDYDNRV